MINQELRNKLIDAYMATIPLITLNVVWFLACVPLVTAIPATGALLYATNQVAHGKPATWATFFEGFRICFRRSWLWGVLNILVAAAAAGYVVIFNQNKAEWTTWATGVVLVIFFLWLTVQLYVFPLLLEQEQPKLLLAFRNSLILVLKRPFYSMLMTALVVALAVATSLLLFPAWLLVTGGVCAYLANVAALNSIAKVTGRKPAPTPAETPYSEIQ